MQVSAVGASLGSLEKYGTAPVRVDALTFYQERLPVLLQNMKSARKACLPPDEKNMPAAFVTFKRRVCQASPYFAPET